MEQEYPDSWKLYWEPNGNVYNPDPFQLPLSGPQGLGGGGGGPRRLGGFEGKGGLGWNYAQGATNGAALGASYLAITTDATLAASELGPWGLVAAGAFDIFASLGLFGGGGPSGPPLYDILRTQHRAHQVYCGVLGICGAIVTQRGHITLAEDDEGEGGDDGDAAREEGQGKAQFDESVSTESTLYGMGRPDWAHTDGGFLAWLRQLQDPQGPSVSNSQADAIVHEARRLGLSVRPDLAGHTGNNPWWRPHLNISGNSLSVHVNVSNKYKLP